ncbi:MAG TPA: rhodanese-like domain-containing protein [Cytophagaceae bacterium]|jgi:rhodanese-related sulfurtransferase
MKYLFLLLLLINCRPSTTFGQNATTNVTKENSVEIIKKVKKEKASLIDVRTQEEYESGHLKYSRNIDYQKKDFSSVISGLPKDRPVYLYCRSGNRSGKALDTMRALGFKQVYNVGGFEGLKSVGFPPND